jgi:hypothetical protein
MMGMVVNEREWITYMLYVVIEHVHCSRVNQSSDNFQIMKITRKKKPLKIPHHDR